MSSQINTYLWETKVKPHGDGASLVSLVIADTDNIEDSEIYITFSVLVKHSECLIIDPGRNRETLFLAELQSRALQTVGNVLKKYYDSFYVSVDNLKGTL